MKAPFRKGDRVQASEVWLARSKWASLPRRVRNNKWYDPKRHGTVTRNSKAACVAVHWDGNSEASTSYMHHTFLIKVPS